MENYRDFTYDSEGTFGGFKELIDEVHSNNMSYIPIIDAAIAQRSGYGAYEDGKD